MSSTAEEGSSGTPTRTAVALSSSAISLLLSSPRPVRLLLVRHGESVSNVRPELIAGRSDDAPPTPLGRLQAEALAHRLQAESYQPHLLLSSTAVRALSTASILYPSLHWLTSDALLEQSQGQWTGQPRALVHSVAVVDSMRRLHVDFAAPGGESIRQVAERAVSDIQQRISGWKGRRGVEEEADGSAGEGDEGAVGGVLDVLVVAHGMVIRALLFHLCGLRGDCVWRVGCANASLTELLIDDRGVSLVRLNDHAHVPRAI